MLDCRNDLFCDASIILNPFITKSSMVINNANAFPKIPKIWVENSKKINVPKKRGIFGN